MTSKAPALTARTLEGCVDLRLGQKPPTDYCVGGVLNEIEITPGLRAWPGSDRDDGMKIWLDGELVGDLWKHGISHVDDGVLPLKPNAGKNHLLLKARNKARDRAMVARLRYHDR